MVRRESFVMNQTRIYNKEKHNFKKRIFNYIAETIKDFAPAVIVMNGSYYKPYENK